MSDDFETFFRENFAAVTGFLIRAGAARVAAEDAVQEAMMLAYRSWSTIRYPRAWVRLVSWRVHAASVVGSNEVLGDIVNGSGWDDDVGQLALDDHTSLGDEERQVLDALRRLPLAQRIVMAWFYDGYRPWEIAVLLGKPAATVRSDLRFARSRLRRDLALSPAGPARWPDLDTTCDARDLAAPVNAARDERITDPNPHRPSAAFDSDTVVAGRRLSADDRVTDGSNGDATTIAAEGDQR